MSAKVTILPEGRREDFPSLDVDKITGQLQEQRLILQNGDDRT